MSEMTDEQQKRARALIKAFRKRDAKEDACPYCDSDEWEEGEDGALFRVHGGNDCAPNAMAELLEEIMGGWR